MLTLGPVAVVAAPGTMPKLAFQRAKLSSSASSFAYSSKLLAAVSLNPVEFLVRSRTGLIAGGDYYTWGGSWDQIIFILGLNRDAVSSFCPRCCAGGDVRSYFGSSAGSSVVLVSV